MRLWHHSEGEEGDISVSPSFLLALDIECIKRDIALKCGTMLTDLQAKISEQGAARGAILFPGLLATPRLKLQLVSA